MKSKWIVIALTAMVALTVVGCSKNSSLTASGTGSSGSKSEGKITIGLSLSTLNNPYFVSLKDGAQKAANEAGATLIVVDAKDNVAKQINDVEDLVQKKVNVILVNPTDSDGIVTAVETANKAKIPVIAVDRKANGGDIASYIASDYVTAGKMAGDYVVKALGGKGNIVELQGISGASATRDYGSGFHSVVDNQAGIKIVASQPADFDRAKGLKVMENILQGNNDIQAVVAHNDEMALGALEAIEASGRKIILLGFDATDDAVKAVNDGRMAATIAEEPFEIGIKAIQTAVQITKGETVPKTIPFDTRLITKQ